MHQVMFPGAFSDRLNRNLKIVCGALIAFVASQILLQIASIPLYYERITSGAVPTVLAGTDVQVSNALVAQWAAERGMTLAAYAAYSIIQNLVITLGFTAVALLILWKARREWFHWLAALVLLLFPTGGLWEFTLVTKIGYSYIALGGLLWPSFLLFLYVFPTGRAVPRWTRWPMGLLIALHFVLQALGLVLILQAAGPLAPKSDPSGSLMGTINDVFPIVIGAAFLLILASQIYRYARVSGAEERAQIKWFVVGLALILALQTIIDWAAGIKNYDAGTQTGLAGDLEELLVLLIPLSIGIAILRYRLFDIDVIINRALVYGVLTAIVVGLYVFVVSYVGALVRTQNDLIVSLAATGLIAVIFQPLRELLQRAVNRLMYGRRDEPVAVLSQLGARLEETIAPDAMLPRLVETVTQALKLPYAAVALTVADQSSIQAQSGQPSASPDAFPLFYQGEMIGQLLVSRRTPGEDFNPADRLLLTNIARQAGAVAHSVKLTAALQRSRQQLVTAREEERRRLRRDLHDGLGPQLASQTLTIEAINKLLEQDPAEARSLLGHLESQSRASIQDIRSLVYGLRPPALDELGLVEALRQEARQLAPGGSLVEITTEPPVLPALPAAVEVAVFRILQEAITNVIRHARATHGTAAIVAHDHHLDLTVTDNGPGLPAEFRLGVGLNSMRERAEELGGTLRFDSPPGGGARLQVRLPLPGEDE